MRHPLVPLPVLARPGRAGFSRDTTLVEHEGTRSHRKLLREICRLLNALHGIMSNASRAKLEGSTELALDTIEALLFSLFCMTGGASQGAALHLLVAAHALTMICTFES